MGGGGGRGLNGYWMVIGGKVGGVVLVKSTIGLYIKGACKGRHVCLCSMSDLPSHFAALERRQQPITGLV